MQLCVDTLLDATFDTLPGTPLRGDQRLIDFIQDWIINSKGKTLHFYFDSEWLEGEENEAQFIKLTRQTQTVANDPI